MARTCGIRKCTNDLFYTKNAMASRQKSSLQATDWYKIVDVVDGKVKTLFHGNQGSRVLPTGEWLLAELKMVKDGTSKTSYLSGWHIIPTLEECLEYLEKFKNVGPKAVIRCKARKIWPKAHSPSNIYLSKWLYIEEVVWRHNGHRLS